MSDDIFNTIDSLYNDLLNIMNQKYAEKMLLYVPVAAAFPAVRRRLVMLARLDRTRRGELAASAETALARTGGRVSVAQSKDRER